MAWKSERMRSITFRKRKLRPTQVGWRLPGDGDMNARVLACMAIIMPLGRKTDLESIQNWLLLMRLDEMVRAQTRAMRNRDDSSDE